MKKLVILFIFFIVLISCKKNTADVNTSGNSDSKFTDTRDGQVYTFKQIGTQIWMTKNLNYAAAGSWCLENEKGYCDTYGRLYDWNTALTVAPSGWHLPSDAEWTKLTDYLGGVTVAGGEMKALVLWNSPNLGATNGSGFSGLPGGYRHSDGYFAGRPNGGSWWSSTASNADLAWSYNLIYFNASVERAAYKKLWGFSVRCIKD